MYYFSTHGWRLVFSLAWAAFGATAPFWAASLRALRSKKLAMVLRWIVFVRLCCERLCAVQNVVAHQFSGFSGDALSTLNLRDAMSADQRQPLKNHEYFRLFANEAASLATFVPKIGILCLSCVIVLILAPPV